MFHNLTPVLFNREKTVIAAFQSILSVITCLQNKTKKKLEKPGGISK
jgi:hypothetical protein